MVVSHRWFLKVAADSRFFLFICDRKSTAVSFVLHRLKLVRQYSLRSRKMRPRQARIRNPSKMPGRDIFMMLGFTMKTITRKV